MKTVKVRIAVAVDAEGNWAAYGFVGASEKVAMAGVAQRLPWGKAEASHWLTAELPVPEAQEIAATVEEAKT